MIILAESMYLNIKFLNSWISSNIFLRAAYGVLFVSAWSTIFVSGLFIKKIQFLNHNFRKYPYFNWFKFENFIFPQFGLNLVINNQELFLCSIFVIHSSLLLLVLLLILYLYLCKYSSIFTYFSDDTNVANSLIISNNIVLCWNFMRFSKLRATFQTAIVTISRFIWITICSDHRMVWIGNLLHTK